MNVAIDMISLSLCMAPSLENLPASSRPAPMSVAAVQRSFRVIHYLKEQGETCFTDLVRLLAPISRTALSHLLKSLEEIGELEHDGRVYRLACTAAVLSPSLRTIYSL